jgi:heat shock protein HtpX
LFDQVTANKRRSAVLMASFVGVVVAAAWVFNALVGGGPAGLLVAAAFVTVMSFAAYWKSDALALAMSHARPADPAQHARLHNVVEGLCIAAGLPKPRLYVVEDDAPNAFATGRDPRHAAVAVTTGLLDKMNRVELEAVLAHELCHVKNYDILVSTLAVTMVGLVSVILPFTARLVRLAVGDRREPLADMSGVSLTRYPPGLIAALEKLRDDRAVVRAGSRATAHLWIEAPPAVGRHAGAHPPLDERIQALREL